jgi:photosystem II stability/assembly factor-like uncharacterized protein
MNPRRRGSAITIMVFFIICSAFTRKAGARWEPTGDLIGPVDIDAMAAGAKGIAASTSLGSVFFSGDGGASWTKILDGEDGSALVPSMVFKGDSLLLTRGYNRPHLLYKKQSAWQSYQMGATRNAHIRRLCVVKGTYFAGTDAGLFTVSTTTADWTKLDSTLFSGTVSVVAAYGDNILAGMSWGGFFLSGDMGITWRPIENGLPPYHTVNAVASVGKALWASVDGYMVYTDSVKIPVRRVYVSADTGKLWMEAGAPFDQFTAMALCGPTLFAGCGTGLWKSPDSGVNWMKVTLGSEDTNVASLAPAGTSLLVGLGRFGGILRTPDGGASWSYASADLTDKTARCLLVSGEKMFTGTRDYVFASFDGAAHWTARPTDFPTVTSLAIKDTLLIAGCSQAFGDEGIYFSSNDGLTWSFDKYGPSTGPITSLFAHENMIFAGMNGYTGMYRSPSGKENWSAMNDGLIVYHGISAYNVNVFAIGAVGATLVTGTDEGIYYSENNGQHWDSAGATMNACAFAAGDGVAYAAAKTQGVLSSADYGRTWKSVNTSLNVISLTAAGKNVFAGGAGGRVSFTSNFGASWTPIDSGLPAADVLSLAVKGTTLFAGCAGKGVWRLALTGSTQVLSERAPPSAEPQARLCMRNGASPCLAVFYHCVKMQRLSIALYDLRGEKISTLFAGPSEVGNHVKTFDMKARTPGTYMVRIRGDAETVSRRIVVAR